MHTIEYPWSADYGMSGFAAITASGRSVRGLDAANIGDVIDALRRSVGPKVAADLGQTMHGVPMGGHALEKW